MISLFLNVPMTDVTKDNIEPKSNTENEMFSRGQNIYLPFFEFNSWENLFFFIFFSPR